jgi:hypothetical protein
MYECICIYACMHISIGATIAQQSLYSVGVLLLPVFNDSTHTHTHACMHNTSTHIYECIHFYICTHLICIHTYLHACMHIHTYIHAYLHTYIHACIHTYIRTYVHACMRVFLLYGHQILVSKHPHLTI